MLTLKYYRETIRPELYRDAGSLITEYDIQFFFKCRLIKFALGVVNVGKI